MSAILFEIERNQKAIYFSGCDTKKKYIAFFIFASIIKAEKEPLLDCWCHFCFKQKKLYFVPHLCCNSSFVPNSFQVTYKNYHNNSDLHSYLLRYPAPHA